MVKNPMGMPGRWDVISEWAAVTPSVASGCITTTGSSDDSVSKDASIPVTDISPQIKFKRLDKTARHIMQILDKEAVEEVRAQREIPDIRHGYIIKLKVETPENKRRISTFKGIVIVKIKILCLIIQLLRMHCDLLKLFDMEVASHLRQVQHDEDQEVARDSRFTFFYMSSFIHYQHFDWCHFLGMQLYRA